MLPLVRCVFKACMLFERALDHLGFTQIMIIVGL